ncbi:protein fem-1 homolog CG6966-like [Ylistrum balloti]|uniref:protein fem-1 homolog CG6966-like n=1 Tax=Ylistrum balloti TaxID=509963 RepID=UPI002905CB5D|nr:protein fem-1 homolog CG6966-like [Ylistrum balloti]
MRKNMSPEIVHSYAHFIQSIIQTGDNKLKVLKENLSSEDLTGDSCTKVLHHLINEKAALYVACEEGDLDIIRYLVSECEVNIEQRGSYTHKHFRDHVPPLWSCTERNSIEVLRLLISLGADINCTSSTNGTALLVGCLHNSEECVNELIKAGADVNIPNIYGATPLLNAASKGSLDLCEFLINNGADVRGRDCNGRTALHRAVEENRLDVVKLLIEKGCDYMLQNDTGESSFRLAALKGNDTIVEYIAQNVSHDAVEIIEMYELLGAFHAEKDDYVKATITWMSALGMRDLNGENPIQKKICDTLDKCTAHREVSSNDGIKRLTSKEDFMMQSLLVRERILGSSHSETIWSLDYCGAVYADMNNYGCCIQLWKCAYRRLVDKRNHYSEDCSFRIQAIMKVFVDIGQENTKFPSEDLLDIFEILICSMQCGSRIFRIRPREELAAKQISILMKMALQLMNLLLSKNLCDSEMERLTHLAECAMKTGIIDDDGKTLLHLSMEEKTSTTNEYTYTMFPSFQVLKLLVDVGANPNIMDNYHNTVLHYCAKPESHKAARYLLDNNAHADARNCDGKSAIEELLSSGYRVCLMDYCTLKCLAATAVTQNKITCWECLPKTLHGFIQIHGLA